MDALDNATKAVAAEIARQQVNARHGLDFDARKIAKAALMAAAYSETNFSSDEPSKNDEYDWTQEDHINTFNGQY